MKVHSTGLALIPSLLSLFLAAFIFYSCHVFQSLEKYLRCFLKPLRVKLTIARLVEYLPSIHEVIGLIPSIALARCRSIHL